jgi:pimeloyl-ACP methyl ester carboxylesterase
MSETIFFNMWQTDSPESREALVSAMRSETSMFVAKPGFRSLTVWAGEGSDNRVLTEGRWASKDDFDVAVANNPETIAGRIRMEKLGRSSPGLFSERFRLDSAAPTNATKPTNSSEVLIETVEHRWSALEFKSSMINVNGVDLHVVSGGKGSPLVLLHGYPQSGEIWRFVAPELAKTHQVIIPDLRGMGLSGISDDGYELPNLANDLHQLITKFGHKHVALAGHDWGGAVGASWALHHRADITRFAFIESALGGAGFESIWAFDHPNPAMTFIPFLLAEPLPESLIVGREEVFLQHLWNTFTHNKDCVPFQYWQPYVDAMKRPGLIRSSASYYRSVYGAVDHIQALIAAGKLTIPVLSISGQFSFGTAQRKFVEAFANNIVSDVVIENSGHFVAEEQPERLMVEFRDFFDD